jgi:hypothetical protein
LLFKRKLLMEMMDIRAAIRWLNESCDLMTVIVKSLESQPKGETDTLKRELIAAQRAAIEATLNNSIIAAILIGDQVILELPLLMGHSEDFLALVKAQGRYREESNKACSVLESTAPVNPTARATPHALEPRTAADLQKRIDELMAKSSPIAAGTTVSTSTAEDSATSMPAPVGPAHIVVEGNDNQTTERI